MTIKLMYFVHGTTTDNEQDIATGWNEGELSKVGIVQAEQLGAVVADKKFDVVFCSDLKRSVDSANIGFSQNKIVVDERLRECNYGNFNGKKKDWDIKDFITKRYPKGESYEDVEKRVRDFLEFLKTKYKGKNIAIVGHQGPQLALNVIINGKTWEQAIQEDWRETKSWRAGWIYEIDE